VHVDLFRQLDQRLLVPHGRHRNFCRERRARDTSRARGFLTADRQSSGARILCWTRRDAIFQRRKRARTRDRQGREHVRAAMVELAWLWLRWQPDSTFLAWFRGWVGKAGGRIKKIMIVALARKLLIALWRYAKDGVIPEGAKMTMA